MTSNAERELKSHIVMRVQTGNDVFVSIVAEGDWSGRDMENIYELLGHSLRAGSFDPKESSHG